MNDFIEFYETNNQKINYYYHKGLRNLTAGELKDLTDAIEYHKNNKNLYEQTLNQRSAEKQPTTKKSRGIRRVAGTLVPIASVATYLGLSGCANPNIPANEADASATQIEQTVKSDDVDVSEINSIVNDVTNFINEGLSKGLFHYELDENDKSIIAKNALDYYLTANQDKLSQETFDILNQYRDMNPEYMYGNTMGFGELLQVYLPGASSANKLDYNTLYINENDVEIVDKIATIVAKMHDAIVARNKDEFDKQVQAAIEFKNMMLGENAKNNMLCDPVALDQALQYLDIADSLANGMIIGDVEADVLNQSIERCLDGQYISNMTKETLEVIANELNVQINSNMSKEEIIEAIHNSIATVSDIPSMRSVLRTLAKGGIEFRINTSLANGLRYNGYDYLTVINEISKGIDLTKFVMPEYEPNQFENENPYGPNAYKDGGVQYGSGTRVDTRYSSSTSSHSTLVNPDQVPASQRTGNEEKYQKADGTPTTKEHLEKTKEELEKKDKNGQSSLDRASEQGATGEALREGSSNSDADKVIEDTYQKNQDYYNQHKDEKEEYTEKVPDGVEEQVGEIEYMVSQSVNTIDSYNEVRDAQAFEDDVLAEIYGSDVEYIDETLHTGMSK